MEDMFARQWLDDGSLAAVRVEARATYGTFTLSDGQASITLDFTYHTSAEREAALKKFARLESVVRQCSTFLRAVRPDDHVSPNDIRLTP